jgi:hypothetical protein
VSLPLSSYMADASNQTELRSLAVLSPLLSHLLPPRGDSLTAHSFVLPVLCGGPGGHPLLITHSCRLFFGSLLVGGVPCSPRASQTALRPCEHGKVLGAPRLFASLASFPLWRIFCFESVSLLGRSTLVPLSAWDDVDASVACSVLTTFRAQRCWVFLALVMSSRLSAGYSRFWQRSRY